MKKALTILVLVFSIIPLQTETIKVDVKESHLFVISENGVHKKAQNEMKKAQFQRKNVEAKENSQKTLAGISNDTDSLSTALNTIKSVANDDLAKADAANRKANLIKPESLSDNTAIEKVMNAVSGKITESKTSSDRLSSLSKL